MERIRSTRTCDFSQVSKRIIVGNPNQSVKIRIFRKTKDQKMLSTNDLKMDIISLLSQINDLDKLRELYEAVRRLGSSSAEKQSEKQTTDFNHAISDLPKGISFQQVLDTQNYQPISYSEFRQLADRIEWDHSLDELLAALD